MRLQLATALIGAFALCVSAQTYATEHHTAQALEHSAMATAADIKVRLDRNKPTGLINRVVPYAYASSNTANYQLARASNKRAPLPDAIAHKH